MSRRGFTLLETMMAMVVGMLVLTTALLVMSVVQRTDSSLAKRATEQSELARTRIVVSRALTRLRLDANNIVRETLIDTHSDEELDEYLDTPYPDPVAGLGFRFDLDELGDFPRLEVVCDQVIAGSIPDTEQQLANTASADGTRIASHDLEGYRGAFEIVINDSNSAYELWWVPLPPENLPDGFWFDELTLPSPTALCRNIAQIKWTAFIDRARLSMVRATESRQLPAYVELEITTTDGVYGSWMFELGWTPGSEISTDAISSNDDDDDLPTGGRG